MNLDVKNNPLSLYIEAIHKGNLKKVQERRGNHKQTMNKEKGEGKNLSEIIRMDPAPMIQSAFSTNTILIICQ